MHGVGIAARIYQVTRGAFVVKPGSLFPALRRLEEQGWIAGEWGPSENNRRARHYTLTRTGRTCEREAYLVPHDFGHELDAGIGRIGALCSAVLRGPLPVPPRPHHIIALF